MAVVLVLVGQCGNQLGDELLTQLTRIVHPASPSTARAAAAPYSPFFSQRDGKARCVLVDTEPKVVHGVYARHGAILRSDNVICGQSGRGNNWALGYYCGAHASDNNSNSSRRHNDGNHRGSSSRACTRDGRASTTGSGAPCGNDDAFRNLGRDQRAADAAVLRDALRAIHRETRRTDDDAAGFDAIVLLHSLAGGTGSGLGARLAEKLRYYFVAPAAGPSSATPSSLPPLPLPLPGTRARQRGGEDGCGAGTDSEGARVHMRTRMQQRPPWTRAAAYDGRNVNEDDDEDEARRRDGLDGLIVAARRARHLLSIAVAPVVAGELATQSINAALALDVLLRSVDAVVLLRNDETIGSGGRRGGPRDRRCPPTTTTTAATATAATAIAPCTTYKEANEVFVGLLLPLLHFGVDAPLRRRRRRQRCDGGMATSDKHRCSSRSGGDDDDDDDDGERYVEGVVGALVRQCVGGTAHTTAACGNRILTLLPLPQRSYIRYRASAARVRVYALSNTRQRMPGCAPETLPLDYVLCPRSATQTQTQTQRRRVDGDKTDADDADDDEDDEAATAVSRTVQLRVPSALLSYYADLQRHGTPVAQLYACLDGVAVVNAVCEVDAAVLLPLLRSAVLKARVGAFLSLYSACGVSADDVTAACKRVARVCDEAEAYTRAQA